MTLPVSALALYDDLKNAYVVEPGDFVFYAGFR